MTYRRGKTIPEPRSAPRQGHHRHASPEEDPVLMEFLLEADHEAGLHLPDTGVGTRGHHRTEKTAKRALQFAPLKADWCS